MYPKFLTPKEIDEEVMKQKLAIEKGCFSHQASMGGKWDVKATVVCTGCGYGYCDECAKRGCFLCMEEGD